MWRALLIALLLAATSAAAQTPQTRWYKGNTHTHTLNSDGDSAPDDVVRWYREHGYQFVVLTDRNFLTSVDGLNALHGADQKFLVVKGEEVTTRSGDLPIHINGLDPSREIAPQSGPSVVDVIQRNVDAIRAANAVPSINHPNFGWAMTTDQIAQVKNDKLFEVYNGHPQVNNLGGGGVPGLEDVWDTLLSRGILLYGVAVDDAHVFKQPGNPDVSGPGRGWVYVRAPRLEPRALVEALERGDFYASTGVELDELRADERSMTVTIKPRPSSKYRIQFIGKGGKVLREATDPSATYAITGTEGYVRAHVVESNGRQAWIQPVIVRQRASGFELAVMLAATAAVASTRRLWTA